MQAARAQHALLVTEFSSQVIQLRKVRHTSNFFVNVSLMQVHAPPAPPNVNVDLVSSGFRRAGVSAEKNSQVGKQILHISPAGETEKRSTLKLGGAGGGWSKTDSWDHCLHWWVCWALCNHLRTKFRHQ